MILPIGDDNPKTHVPYVHYAIIGLNVAVFLYMIGLTRSQQEAFVLQWGFIPERGHVVNMLTALYIHGGLAHIFFNMLFLWIVGDNVEDRMGSVGYVLFYHAAGVAGNLAHWSLNSTSAIPVVGASGAISGVMGAYVVLFPNAKIKIFYWLFFFFVNTVYVSAKWAIGLWFLQQVLMILLVHHSGVAYDAHIAGLLFGAIIALVARQALLGKHDTVRRIVRPQYEGPELRWEEEGPPVGIPVVEAVPAGSAARVRRDDNVHVLDPLKQGDLRGAYHAFVHLAEGATPFTLSETTLMTLGDALMSAGLYGPAAKVYEVTLSHLPEGHQGGEASFRLGMILSREFRDYTHARTWLLHAMHRHGHPSRQAQARDELMRIDAYLRSTRLRPRRGPAWVIRQTDDPYDVSAAARTVARHLGISAESAETSLRESPGIIARDVATSAAQGLAEALQARGIPVLLVASREVIVPPPAVSARVVRFSTHGLRFELASAVATKTWQETYLVSCGVVGRGEDARRVVDFFFSDGEVPAHVRVVEGAFSFDYPRMPRELRRDVPAFMEVLLTNASDVPMNRGMQLADHAPDDAAWEGLRFDTIRAFDQYNTWFLQLIGAASMTAEAQ